MSIAARRLQRVDPERSAQLPTEGLWFAWQGTDTLNAQTTKRVFAHYWPPIVRSIDNTPLAVNDYQSRHYLTPNGDGDNGFGGWCRDRTWPRNQRSGNWKVDDAYDEVSWAAAAGIDGFYVDIITLSSSNWQWGRCLNLRDAGTMWNQNTGSTFKMVPMIDASGSVANETPSTVAAAIAEFAGRSTTYFNEDGHMVIGTFKMEGKSLSVWQAILAALQANHGITGKFVGVYNTYSAASGYDAVQYACGPWGVGADPNVWANHSNMAGVARSRSQKWQAAVWSQDIRPRSDWFDEACNTASLRGAWTRAITDNADLIQLCTWSDMSEGSHFYPTPLRGRVALDLTAWYITKWKTGSFPTILRDALFLSHRTQMASATITGPQTRWMIQKSRGTMSPFQEKVEALVFLIQPATVTITVNGVQSSFSAPAGMSVYTVNATAGAVAAVVVRGGMTVAQVTSPIGIVSSAFVQDRQYAMFGSIRGTSGQFNPQRAVDGSFATYPNPIPNLS